MSFLFIQQSPDILHLLGWFLVSYLSGSVPYGLLLTKLAGLGDIRKVGSGNIGATNVLRAGGKKLAALTLVLDALKAYAPVAVALSIHSDYAVVAALGAFLGHLAPVWLKFKGGKGVASAIGICFAFSWLVGLSVCGVWLATALISRYSSLSALIAFAAAPLIAARVTQDYQATIVILVIAVVVWFRHNANIGRLVAGTESRIGKKA